MSFLCSQSILSVVMYFFEVFSDYPNQFPCAGTIQCHLYHPILVLLQDFPSGNYIGTDGTKALAHALTINTTVHTIDLYGFPYSPPNASVFTCLAFSLSPVLIIQNISKLILHLWLMVFRFNKHNENDRGMRSYHLVLFQTVLVYLLPINHVCLSVAVRCPLLCSQQNKVCE